METLLVLLLTGSLFTSSLQYLSKTNIFTASYEKNIIDNIKTTLSIARQYALIIKQPITVYPSKSNLIIKNNTQIFSNKKILLKNSDTLSANFFGNKFLQFLPDGTTNTTNGKFILNNKYCIIVSKLGRIKYYKI